MLVVQNARRPIPSRPRDIVPGGEQASGVAFGTLLVMAPAGESEAARSLRAVKLVHTAVWAFFAGSIVAIPCFAWVGRLREALILIAVVLVEVLVLVVNRWRCPLTGVAARYTQDRRANFDIFLPEWLARHNKLIFGALYVAGTLFTLARWRHWPL